MLKEIIMKLSKEKKIDLDYDELVEANHTTIAYGLLYDVLPTLKQRAPPKFSCSEIKRTRKQASYAIKEGIQEAWNHKGQGAI